jgi:RNAse (barnase) inhibitor barstar
MPIPVQLLKFVDDPSKYRPHDAFVARLPLGIDAKRRLLSVLYERLAFPDYFGFNWDALSDCLRDLNWIGQKQIVILHDELPNLSEEDLRTYISILSDAAIDWNRSEEHELEIIFPERVREIVNSLFQ